MSVETLAQAMQEAGILDKTTVEARLPRYRSGRQLLDGLIGEGLITEQNLVSQLARALSVPRYDPKERSPEPDAVSLIDSRAAEELGVLPVAVRGGGALLWVALCDPTDEGLIGEVTRRTGRRVKACLIGPRELARALQQLGQGAGVPQMPSAAQPGFPPPNPGTTGGQYRIPLPSGVGGMQTSMGPSGYPPMPQMMPNGIPQGMQPMPGGMSGVYPYGYPQHQQTMAPIPQAAPPMQSAVPMPPPMGQTQPGFVPQPPTYTNGLSARSGESQRIEEELAQVKQVVKVLTQMLVERGMLDGEDLKRRLRAERERKG